MHIRYFLSLFFLVTMLHASDDDSCKSSGYIAEGKLPSSFNFKECEELDQECIEKRESFISQYKKRNKTSKFYTENNIKVSVTTNRDAVVTQYIKDGDIYINVQ